MAAHRVFISYSHTHDKDWARQFAESLRERGLDVWFDDWSVHLGDSLPDAIESGLRDSDLLVLLVGPETAMGPNVWFELGAAVAMGKRVVPIVPADADLSRLPGSIRLRKFLIKRAPQEVAEELVAGEGAFPLR
ncbi:MAG: toll/interleukin-1 receptor domain-containing protein [Chloroflexi bacterium]|nr:toll/interleukin-1 receptor domain-containing protein [Chloroflexota bacterium]